MFSIYINTEWRNGTPPYVYALREQSGIYSVGSIYSPNSNPIYTIEQKLNTANKTDYYQPTENKSKTSEKNKL